MWRHESGDGDYGGTVTELRAPDGSWAEVTREPDPENRYHLREAGPTPLWAHVETAWEQWTGLGCPQWHEFGLTATPTRHTVWHGSPDGPSWLLPVPGTGRAHSRRTALGQGRSRDSLRNTDAGNGAVGTAKGVAALIA